MRLSYSVSILWVLTRLFVTALLRLCSEVETTRAGWDKYMRVVSKETAAKDTAMIGLQERETKLQTELERSREETQR